MNNRTASGAVSACGTAVIHPPKFLFHKNLGGFIICLPHFPPPYFNTFWQAGSR